MMSCHLLGRNQRRGEGPKIKNILEGAFLLFLIWLAYKIRQAYDKRHESLFKFREEDRTAYLARLRKMGYDSDAYIYPEEVDASGQLYKENNGGSISTEGSMYSQKEDNAEIRNNSLEQIGNTNVEQGLSEEIGLRKEDDVAGNFTIDTRNNDETGDDMSNSDTLDNSEYVLNREGANSRESMSESPSEEDNALSLKQETVEYQSDNILGGHTSDSDTSEEANSDKAFGGEHTESSLGYDQHNEGIRTNSEALDPDGEAGEYQGVVENGKHGIDSSEEGVKDLDGGAANSSQNNEQLGMEIENNMLTDR